MITKPTIYSSKAELIQAATDAIAGAIKNSVAERGTCYVALAGGRSPRDIYARLAISQSDQIPWRDVHLFWGDERAVPPDHPASNYGMARESLLRHIAIPDANVHRISGEMEPGIAASEYTEVIARTLPTSPPRLDLVLLGIGEDAHTASLFPGTDALDEQKEDVTAVFVEKLETWRITMTLQMLNRAREVIFLVSGKSKAGIVQLISRLKAPSKEYPATLIDPNHGDVRWMLDSEAARLIGT